MDKYTVRSSASCSEITSMVECESISPGHIPNPVPRLWSQDDGTLTMATEYETTRRISRVIPYSAARSLPSNEVLLSNCRQYSVGSNFDNSNLRLSMNGEVKALKHVLLKRLCSSSSALQQNSAGRRSCENLDVNVAMKLDLFKRISPRAMAQQITLLEMKHFKAINSNELESLSWNSKDKLQTAPNIVASTNWFNQLLFWVQKDILDEEILFNRANTMSYFIRVAKKLVEIYNFGSAMAIVSGLQVQCVYRLEATWVALSARDRTNFKKLADLFSPERNYNQLRTALDNARLPCIPYLGLYLTDLVHIDVAAAASTHHDANAIRKERVRKVLDSIDRFQQSSYPFHTNQRLVEFFEGQHYIEELLHFIEAANYKTSLRLEPPLEGDRSQLIPATVYTRHSAGPVTSPLATDENFAVL